MLPASLAVLDTFSFTHPTTLGDLEQLFHLVRRLTWPPGTTVDVNRIGDVVTLKVATRAREYVRTYPVR